MLERAVGLPAVAGSTQMSRRDPQRETAFLTEAARGHAPFVEQATARLDMGEEIYGDSWAWIGLRRHLAELLEEAADLGSWAALASQALDTEPGCRRPTGRDWPACSRPPLGTARGLTRC